MGSGLQQAIAHGVEKGLGERVPGIVDVCLSALWDHPWFPFIAGGQLRLIEAGMAPKKAWALARKVCVEFVREEKIAFGDPGWDWSPTGGRTVVEECEIAHWDAA